MRVLVISKFGYVRGGLERVMFDEMAWLRAAGHEAELFATAHPENIDGLRFVSRFPRYFELGSSSRSLRAVPNMFWNREAASALAGVVAEYRPDVIHCHGIHRHLSPSIFPVARDAGVPVVLTTHDYFLVCPAYTLLRSGSSVCSPRRCGRLCFSQAALNRCVSGSVARSSLAAAELGWQRATKAYERGVDRFIAPSGFIAGQLADGGFDHRRIRVVPNATPGASTPAVPADERRGVLFAGRLAPEKGLAVVVSAAEAASVPLRIAGDGRDAGAARSSANATLLGRLDNASLAAEIGQARAVVVPSLWFENAPMAILEAMALGTPVIASAIGGIPEQIEHDVSGLLVPPGDLTALSEAIRRVAADDALVARLGQAARERVERDFSPQRHLDALLGVYAEAGAAS